MDYVLAASSDEQHAVFLEQAFHAQPGTITVTCMTKGSELLNFICNRPPNDFPFLVVIDQYLADIDSLTLLLKLKADQHRKLVPVAIMSGYASEELIREYYRAGANCFYKKPLDLPDWSHMAECLVTLFYNKY